MMSRSHWRTTLNEKSSYLPTMHFTRKFNELETENHLKELKDHVQPFNLNLFKRKNTAQKYDIRSYNLNFSVGP